MCRSVIAIAKKDFDKSLIFTILPKIFWFKDCEDLDLPFRIQDWLSRPQACYPQINRYLKTFFGNNFDSLIKIIDVLKLKFNKSMEQKVE